MNTITTLHMLRQHLGFAPDDTSEDRRLLMVLMAATSRIERVTNRHFSPYQATLLHDIDPDNTTLIDLKDDLLELIAIEDIGPIEVQDTLLLSGDSLKLQSGIPFQYEATPLQAVAVTGIWGWHDRWSTAWQANVDALQNTLNDSSTVITVADVDGGTPLDDGPRFQVGNLIRIDDEYMRVLSLNTVSNTITVQRAVNGTTAASHNSATNVAVYQPSADVEMLCLQLATWLYRQPDDAANLPNTFAEQMSALRRIRVKA